MTWLNQPWRSSLRPSGTLALLAAVALGLAGCNTVAGAGKDVSNTGTAITHTAKNVEQKM